MRVKKQGDFYHITHITGPNHNALLISFAMDAKSGLTTPVIESLPSVGDCQHENLNSDTILSEVLEGVREGNSRFGTAYQVQKIQYIQNDTRPESTYRYLVLKLIEHLVNANNENVENS